MKNGFAFLIAPFLVAMFALVAGYTALRWLFGAAFGVDSVWNHILDVAIPFLLCGFVSLRIFLPRISGFVPDSGTMKTVLLFLTWLLLFIPVVIAQKCLSVAAPKIQELATINEIDYFESQEFYRLDQYYIDQKRVIVNHKFDVEGATQDKLTMRIYVLAPILESVNDRFSPLAWLGIQYYKTISNRLSPLKKQQLFEAFGNKVKAEFEGGDLSKFTYFKRLDAADPSNMFSVILKDQFFQPSGTAVLEGYETPVEQWNPGRLLFLMVSILAGIILYTTIVWVSRPRHVTAEVISDDTDAVSQPVRFDSHIFLPRDDFWATPVIVYLNTALFLAMIFSGIGLIRFDGMALLDWGGNLRPLTTEGNWWRLGSYMFVHCGIIHFGMNMISLMFIGTLLEPVVGSMRLAMVYLVSGVIGGIASISWYPMTVSVGASGAIMGLFGFFIALLLTKVHSTSGSKSLLASCLILVGLTLAGNIDDGIDAAVHLGGFVSGLVIGLILHPTIAEHSDE